MATIYYARVGEDWRKEAKYDFLAEKQCISGVDWRVLNPDARHTWLTEGMSEEFEAFLPMGTKEGKSATTGEAETIFKVYSRGICSNGDAYVYNFNSEALAEIAQGMIEAYNSEYYRWMAQGRPKNLDGFLRVDETKLKWIRRTKRSLLRGLEVKFDESNIRHAMYRPFCQQCHYFETIFNEDVYRFSQIFPMPETEAENYVICVPSIGGRTGFWALCTDAIPNVSLTSIDASQCFPYYTYDENGENRRENITDWALAQFREHYPPSIPPKRGEAGGVGAGNIPPVGGDRGGELTKWDIFHYIYALLHHPDYRETYAANLKRDLPRIPFAPEFWPFVEAGRKLAELHVHYEDQPPYPLQWIESPDAPLSYRVEKLRLSPDKTQIVVNDFLTLAGIPAEAFEYRLGNRSALDWVIDRYRVTKDERSGIVNDPNRAADPQYIVRLIGQVATVSVETVGIVRGLPGLKA